MGLAMGLAAAGDMGTNSGACTLNLKGVAVALAAAGPGGATAAATAAPSSSLVAALVAHLTTTSLLSCAMAAARLLELVRWWSVGY
jgi:hypothetical protein